MPDITMPDAYVVSENHGTELKFSARMWDAKGERIIITYEMHDGTPGGWLGPKLTVVVSKDGTVMTKLDGTTKDFPNIKFDTAAVQALLDKTPMNNFIENQGGDLRTEP